MPFGNLNVDTVTTSTAGGVLGAGNASIMKNRLINGAMLVSQRNGTSSVTLAAGADQYTIDRYDVQNNTTSGAFTCQQVATAPAGFVKSMKITVTATEASPTSTLKARIWQAIEGLNCTDLAWGTADAKTVTLSFWVQSSVTGTFGGSLGNNSDNRAYPFTYTISAANTWEQKSITIAGDTTGTWATDNSTGILLNISLLAGTSRSGTAGAWNSNWNTSATGATNLLATNGATFYITGVQLEVGSSATGFEYVNYQTSLANCQRYFQTYGTTAGTAIMPYGSAASAAEIDNYMVLPVVMRTTPTFTSTNLTASDGVAAALTMTNGTIYNATNSIFGAYWTVSGATTYRPYLVKANGSGGSMQLSAEL